MAGMNNLDYAIIALVALGGFYGLTRGALRMVTAILSVTLGIVAAAAWYGRVGAVVAQHFHTTSTVSAVVGYIVVFVAVAAAIEFAGRRIVRLARIINLNWIDRVGGALLGAALAAGVAGVGVRLLAGLLAGDCM